MSPPEKPARKIKLWKLLLLVFLTSVVLAEFYIRFRMQR
jgi:hypothetical protein